MTIVQRYLFFEVLRAVLIIVGGLSLLALLAQGLSRTDLILENRQSALTYFYIVGLGAPQIIALLMPLALFVASVWSLNRIHKDSEIVVAQAAGMTRWQIASPIMRLAVLLAIAHLSVNLWVQPAAQREMRESVNVVRADIAAALIRPGQFTSSGDRLTFYAREQNGSDLRGILISDATDIEFPVDYIAQAGKMVNVDGKPAIVLARGQVQQLDENNALSVLKFEQWTFDLSEYMREDSEVVLKPSDKYLHELFFVDETNYFQRKDADALFAEGHSRLTSPLLNLLMVLLAVVAVLGGDFSRRGYSRRISIATGLALAAVIIQLALQSEAVRNRDMNIALWLFPLLSILILSILYFYKGRSKSSSVQRPRLGLSTRRGIIHVQPDRES